VRRNRVNEVSSTYSIFYNLKRWFFVPLAAASVLLGCGCGGVPPHGPHWASVGHRCASDAPATSLPAAARDSLSPADTLHNPDDRWAQRARAVPGGWGGFFIDNGVPTIYLVDTTQRAHALAALNRPGLDGMVLGADVQVRRGRWDYAQLDDWYRYLNQRLALSELVSSDIEEGANRIMYTVTGDGAIARLEARLAALHVPCFLVAVESVAGYPRLATTPR
jgi:hypothetical protein